MPLETELALLKQRLENCEDNVDVILKQKTVRWVVGVFGVAAILIVGAMLNTSREYGNLEQAVKNMNEQSIPAIHEQNREMKRHLERIDDRFERLYGFQRKDTPNN